MEQEQTVYSLLFTWRKRCVCRYANGDCLSWSAGIATLPLGWTIATFTWVSLISNRFHTFISSSRKLAFGLCWLRSCTDTTPPTTFYCGIGVWHPPQHFIASLFTIRVAVIGSFWQLTREWGVLWKGAFYILHFFLAGPPILPSVDLHTG